MPTRILVVEDDQDIAQLVARYLEKAGLAIGDVNLVRESVPDERDLDGLPERAAEEEERRGGDRLRAHGDAASAADEALAEEPEPSRELVDARSGPSGRARGRCRPGRSGGKTPT